MPAAAAVLLMTCDRRDSFPECRGQFGHSQKTPPLLRLSLSHTPQLLGKPIEALLETVSYCESQIIVTVYDEEGFMNDKDINNYRIQLKGRLSNGRKRALRNSRASIADPWQGRGKICGVSIRDGDRYDAERGRTDIERLSKNLENRILVKLSLNEGAHFLTSGIQTSENSSDQQRTAPDISNV
ncbi:hypothetical protein DFS33DRAFT_1272517 [Desarmillaria ectypa]|nr:hypothetical protein DFS33DRAFT_1272517 [Desarmillaria ectypa]